MSGSKKHSEKNETNHVKTGEADIDEKIFATEENADSAETGEQENPEADQSREEITDTEKELAACKNRHLRLQADFDNFRKRSIKESADLIRTATRDFIERLLPVLDHFELGLKAAEEAGANESVTEGFRLVYNQLLDELKNAGVTPFDSEGTPFDHNLHDCISRMPSEEYPEDVIATQIRRGYYINDKVLRHAQVVASSGPAQSTANDTQPTTDPDTEEQQEK